MYFQQFYLSCLSQASYMLASEGVAAVVDPQRDVDLYIEEARAQGFVIKYILETHLHADFVSGHQELANRTGAQIYLSAQARATFPHVPVRDGDAIEFGKCRIDFLETPGHTLESICAAVTDTEKSPEPFAVLTGDTLFIGDVGRPDLSAGHTPQELAGLLYDSLHNKLMKLGDNVAVYPAHGAGSLCGRQMSTEKSSTIGQEKISNYALRPSKREDFVRLLTAELPERPGYFALDVEINRGGASPVGELPDLLALPALELRRRIRAGAIVLDTRPAIEFAAGHVPGSVHIGLAGEFASWAGIVIGVGPEVILVAEDPEALSESRLRLARVGIERITGYVADWNGQPFARLPQISVEELRDAPRAPQIVDVRRPAEWEQGHIHGAILKPLNQLAHSTAGLDPRRPTAVHCKSGYRSSIAASLLQRAGFAEVANVTGGFDAWLACGLPVSL